MKWTKTELISYVETKVKEAMSYIENDDFYSATFAFREIANNLLHHAVTLG